MNAIGGHRVKCSKPGSERQRPQVFSHLWKIDPKDKHIHKASMIIYKLVCRTCLHSGATLWNLGKEGGKEKRMIEHQ
jgi:hypothetical protein